MNSTHSKIILAISLILMFNSTYSQHNGKELVSVNLSIVGKGKPIICSDSLASYFVVINVLNTQDTTVRFWNLNCTGLIDNFFIKGDSVFFGSCFSGCDREVPEEIMLPPKKMVQLNATITSYKKDFSIQRIKIGFKYFTTFHDAYNYGIENNKKNKIRIVWSNEVELKDNLYSYEVK